MTAADIYDIVYNTLQEQGLDTDETEVEDKMRDLAMAVARHNGCKID